MADQSAVFDCEAYGPEGLEIGALCFLAEPNERVCSTREECHTAMTAERQRVFRRIGELAAAGDPMGEYLAGEFSSPDQILGGAEPETTDD